MTCRMGLALVLFLLPPAAPEPDMPASSAARTPRLYGDVDASGTVDRTDALLVLTWALGFGAPPDTLTFNVANVAPANSPGTGGEPDEDPPGWGPAPACARTLDLDDAAAILEKALGRPAPVAGAPLPDAWLRPVRCGGVPSAPADTLLSSLQEPETFTEDRTYLAGRFRKDVVSLIFARGTTRSQRQAILDRVHGKVVGGLELYHPDGWFYIQVPAGGSPRSLAEVIQLLKSTPGVETATPDYVGDIVGEQPRPVDGPDWREW